MFYKYQKENTEKHGTWDLQLESDLIPIDEETFKKDLENLKVAQSKLLEFDVDEILEFLDTLVSKWIMDPLFTKRYGDLGISFLLSFMRKENLSNLLEASLIGNRKSLDRFTSLPGMDKQLIATPRGIITHWLAGNVPVLGMISIIQGIITKNINVIKLPRENGRVLPEMLSEFKSLSITTSKGNVFSGEHIYSCVAFYYCDRTDASAQKQLSVNSDVRVAWGGREAVESVMQLPRRYGTQDVIFGPKYSFAAIGKNSVRRDNVVEISKKLAMDASFFEQQGCNSPHTVFIENGGEIDYVEFGEHLANAMKKVLKRIPKRDIRNSQIGNILNTRMDYMLDGIVHSSKGIDWTVIVSDEQGLADACYNRTVFVRPVNSIDEIVHFVEHNKHQSIGLALEDSRLIELSIELARKGIERVTEVGKMSVYDHPWDGMLPLARFIRWTSRPKT